MYKLLKYLVISQINLRHCYITGLSKNIITKDTYTYDEQPIFLFEQTVDLETLPILVNI